MDARRGQGGGGGVLKGGGAHEGEGSAIKNCSMAAHLQHCSCRHSASTSWLLLWLQPHHCDNAPDHVPQLPVVLPARAHHPHLQLSRRQNKLTQRASGAPQARTHRVWFNGGQGQGRRPGTLQPTSGFSSAGFGLSRQAQACVHVTSAPRADQHRRPGCRGAVLTRLPTAAATARKHARARAAWCAHSWLLRRHILPYLLSG